MSDKLTYQISLAGLIGLTVAFPWWLHVNTTQLGMLGAVLLGAVTPLLLIRATAKKSRNWSGITALCMIPLAVIGIMEIVATLGKPDSGMAIGVLAIVVFFSVLDAGRRNPN